MNRKRKRAKKGNMNVKNESTAFQNSQDRRWKSKSIKKETGKIYNSESTKSKTRQREKLWNCQGEKRNKIKTTPGMEECKSYKANKEFEGQEHQQVRDKEESSVNWWMLGILRRRKRRKRRKQYKKGKKRGFDEKQVWWRRRPTSVSEGGEGEFQVRKWCAQI